MRRLGRLSTVVRHCGKYYAFAAKQTMSNTPSRPEATPPAGTPERPAVPARRAEDEPKAERPAPDPTRYGDWEKNGRCIDF
jgi:hypothetical protein